MKPTREELETAWDRRLQTDRRELSDYLASVDDRHHIDPRLVPPIVWGFTAWDYIDPAERDMIFAGMTRRMLQRAGQVMPVYQRSESFQAALHDGRAAINSMDDLVGFPMLVKDGEHGFRWRALEDPFILAPTDAESTSTTLTVYKSGGTGINEATEGKATPTFLSDRDMKMESQASMTRLLMPIGFYPGMRVMNVYSVEHKGGVMLNIAFHLLGVGLLHPRRQTEDLNVIVNDIERYGIDAIAVVPGTVQTAKTGQGPAKGGGITFQSIYGRDRALFGPKVHTAFITGYAISDDVVALAERLRERYDMRVSSGWGASEAHPGGVSPVFGSEERICKYNSQHLIQGPHHLGVVDISSGTPRPVRVGEEGLLLVTTFGRHDGTLFANYVIGDKVKLESLDCACGRTTPVVSNIRREDNERELIAGGCAYS